MHTCRNPPSCTVLVGTEHERIHTCTHNCYMYITALCQTLTVMCNCTQTNLGLGLGASPCGSRVIYNFVSGRSGFHTGEGRGVCMGIASTATVGYNTIPKYNISVGLMCYCWIWWLKYVQNFIKVYRTLAGALTCDVCMRPLCTFPLPPHHQENILYETLTVHLSVRNCHLGTCKQNAIIGSVYLSLWSSDNKYSL